MDADFPEDVYASYGPEFGAWRAALLEGHCPTCAAEIDMVVVDPYYAGVLHRTMGACGACECRWELCRLDDRVVEDFAGRRADG